MRIPRIYTESDLSTGSNIQLDKATSSYLLKVLRLKTDSELHLINGQPIQDQYGYFRARICSDNKSADVLVEDFIADNNESPLSITLMQGISKGDHMDLTIQKATELGVSEIIPVVCERTVVNLKADRLDKKMRHWHGIMTSACEQSGRNHLMTIRQPLRFDQLQLSAEQTGFILQPESPQSITSFTSLTSVALLIGPEGGFTEQEITLAISNRFEAIRFGPRILRTETAAIAAISIMQSLWGDLD